MLSEDLLLEVFLRIDNPADISRAACCCRQWRTVSRTEEIWKAHSFVAWKLSGRKFNRTHVVEKYHGSWHWMFMRRPRLRFDGIYVSRNTYVKPGAPGWGYSAPVHLVVYYRYFVFRPGGTFVFKISPTPVKLIYKELIKTRKTCEKGQKTYVGEWGLEADMLVTMFLYPGISPTENRSEGCVRSTCPGANNRIDVKRLLSSYEHSDPETEANGGGTHVHREHSQRVKISSYVFVPLEEVETHVLNQPVEVMDYYAPG